MCTVDAEPKFHHSAWGCVVVQRIGDAQVLRNFHGVLVKYYSSITGRDDLDGIRRSVKELLDPYGNGRNVCLSRIKKAFRVAVGEPVAGFYYVDGKYGEARKVRLDRDYVIWEH